MSQKTAEAYPDKHFFVESITKDITLFDCVLDLIDNAIDSASTHLGAKDVLEKPGCLNGIEIKISFDETQFTITDNAKGITLGDAEKRVFRFGSIKTDSNHSIGYYGIGLKRAAFKIGKNIIVKSVSSEEKFTVTMNLTEWMAKPEIWTFPIDLTDVVTKPATFSDTGVGITITELNTDIANAFATDQFKTKLIETIGRDYYFFLKAGVQIFINGNPVSSVSIDVKTSGDFLPGIRVWNEDGVDIKLLSGCHSAIEADPNDPENIDPRSKYSGWYVICNNRIVLAANKDDKTVWKTRADGFTQWHPQYNGFIGFAFFSSKDLQKLPWTTTKRAVDQESSIYREVVKQMMQMTTPYIKYTTSRKVDLEEAKRNEEAATSTSLAAMMLPNALPTATALPVFPIVDPKTSKVEQSVIRFEVEKFRADKAKIEIGMPNMTNQQLGKYVFEEFYQNNVE